VTTELRRLGRTVLAAGLAIVASGCASQATPRADLRTDVGEVPANMQSDYESFASNCSKCHGLERALAAPVTDNKHWDIYVAKMMRTAGSAIHADEAPHILRFLYWYTDRKMGRETEGAKAAPVTTPQSSRGSSPAHKEAAPAGGAPSVPADAPAPAQPVTSETQGEGTP